MNCFWLQVSAMIFAAAGMIMGTIGVFRRLHEQKSGFGPSSLQALAIVFFLPSVIVIAAVSHISSEALAALLGTIAGYILASPKRDDKSEKQSKDKASDQPQPQPK